MDSTSRSQMQQPQKKPKWKGKAIADVSGVAAEQVWPLLEDFCGLNKYFPTPTCLLVEGVNGQPGCVRYCAGFITHIKRNDGALNWTKQKLHSIDPKKMTITYSIIDSNVGFNSYVATWNVVPKEGHGCVIEWLYEVEPVEGWTLADLNAFCGSGLKAMGKKIEATLCASV